MELLLLEFEQPGGTLLLVSILLFDPSTDRLYIRNRDDLGGLDADDAEIVGPLLAQLADESRSMVGSAILQQLEDSLSNSIRISERSKIRVDDVNTALDELAAQHFL